MTTLQHRMNRDEIETRMVMRGSGLRLSGLPS
jgi:hypothetical protein